MKLVSGDVLDASSLPSNAINECSSSGSVDEAVAFWVNSLNFEVDELAAKSHLSKYGAWSTDDLNAMTATRLNETILWLACCDISEGNDFYFEGSK